MRISLTASAAGAEAGVIASMARPAAHPRREILDIVILREVTRSKQIAARRQREPEQAGHPRPSRRCQNPFTLQGDRITVKAKKKSIFAAMAGGWRYSK